MSDEGSAAAGGSGNTIKLVVAVVILLAAAYFAYANFLGGGNSKPTSAVDKLSEERKQEIREEQDKIKIPEEQIGGA